MALFKTTTVLERDLEEWCLETWAWLMRNLDGIERLKATLLVRANSKFFPPTEAKGHARAEYVFELIKRQMGMADWPCELRAYERREANLRTPTPSGFSLMALGKRGVARDRGR